MAEDLGFHRTVADVRLERIVYAHQTTTLAGAAGRLHTGYGALVLTDPVRVVTAQDVVSAIAAGRALDTPLSECGFDRPIVLAQSTPLEQALHTLLDEPDRCVVIVDRAGQGIGRLTLDGAMKCLISQPPWLHALQLVVQPGESTLLEIEL